MPSIYLKKRRHLYLSASGSTIQSKQTREYEGQVYPYVTLDISSASHPFYTGEIRQASNEGRVASFNKRFARFKRS